MPGRARKGRVVTPPGRTERQRGVTLRPRALEDAAPAEPERRRETTTDDFD